MPTRKKKGARRKGPSPAVWRKNFEKRRDFQPGDDPRRHTLTAEESAPTQFQPGGAPTLAHGLRVHSRQALRVIPKEFHVVVEPDAGLERLETYLTPLIDLTASVHRSLVELATFKNLRAQTKYSQLGKRAIKMRLQLQGHSLSAYDAGDASSEQVQAAQRDAARLLSGDLTKINHAVHWMDSLLSDVVDERDHVLPWIESLSGVIASATNHLETLAQIVLWLEERHERPEDDEYFRAFYQRRRLVGG